MSAVDVYLPVCVQVRDGVVLGGYVDLEGMPWADVDGRNTWDLVEDDWIRDSDLPDEGDMAVQWLSGRLSLEESGPVADVIEEVGK